MKDIKHLSGIAAQVRKDVLTMCHKNKAAHLGSAYSIVEILVSLYHHFLKVDPAFPTAIDRDRFILSKGHSISALYSLLSQLGFFSRDMLDTYNLNGSSLPEHGFPNCVPGLDFATGSLGHGLSVGSGIALAAKVQNLAYKVAVLLSDGECNEGSVWEAAMFASGKKLTNLVAIIDYNKWQGIDRSNSVLKMDPLVDKWASFGWDTYEIDGHDLQALCNLLDTIDTKERTQPVAIIANTVKGRGVDFMEDDNNWHYRIPSVEEYDAALRQLEVV